MNKLSSTSQVPPTMRTALITTPRRQPSQARLTQAQIPPNGQIQFALGKATGRVRHN